MSATRPEPDRFWEKVNKNGPISEKRPDLGQCWLWTAGKFGRNQEYGCFYLQGGRKAIPAHVWSYQNIIGPTTEGLVLDHLCMVTLCVNPLHLEEVTHQINILRGKGVAAMEARQVVCKNGHSLADAHILPSGSRDCRICRKNRASNRTREYRRVHG